MTVLHPKYKLEYFENKGWDNDFIDTAKKTVFEEFDRAYVHLPAGDGAADSTSKANGVKVRLSRLSTDLNSLSYCRRAGLGTCLTMMNP